LQREAETKIDHHDVKQLFIATPTVSLAPHSRQNFNAELCDTSPLLQRLAIDVKDVASHIHRHQDHHVVVNFHGSQLHGFSIRHLVAYKTGIATRAARDRRVTSCWFTILCE
jgi:hypothetical protein